MSQTAPKDAVVWTEIPVKDLDKAMTFYGTVLGNPLTIMEMGPNKTAVFAAEDQSSVSGHLYEGEPAQGGSGNTVHLAVGAPLEAALERVSAEGGTVVSDPIEIPAGRFAYCLDPDGNSIGLFTR